MQSTEIPGSRPRIKLALRDRAGLWRAGRRVRREHRRAALEHYRAALYALATAKQEAISQCRGRQWAGSEEERELTRAALRLSLAVPPRWRR